MQVAATPVARVALKESVQQIFLFSVFERNFVVVGASLIS